jgi:hypothetical protein
LGGDPIEAAIDRYRTGEIDACAVDETIHHYHRAAAELWKFCFGRDGGTHAEFIAGLLGPYDRRRRSDRLVGTRYTETTPMIRTARRSRRECRGCDRPWPLPTAIERPVPPICTAVVIDKLAGQDVPKDRSGGLRVSVQAKPGSALRKAASADG